MDWNDHENNAAVNNDQEEDIDADVGEDTDEDVGNNVDESMQLEGALEQRPRRQLTQPSWLRDYVTGEGLSDSDLNPILLSKMMIILFTMKRHKIIQFGGEP